MTKGLAFLSLSLLLYVWITSVVRSLKGGLYEASLYVSPWFSEALPPDREPSRHHQLQTEADAWRHPPLTCYYPMEAWYSAEKNPTGKRSIIFKAEGGFGLPFKVPCGKCIGCRLDRAQDWAIRLSHEAHFHDRCAFVTLTYSDEHLPADGSLCVRDVQLFLKRLREAMGGNGAHAFNPPLTDRLRFFAVGEYGEKTGRAHYHLLLFGCDFREDRKVRGRSRNGAHQRYVSAQLDAIWGKGFCEVGTFTSHSAGYCARYSMKKVYGEPAEKHYNGRKPEFMTCSKGIGRLWWEIYGEQTLRNDFVVVKGKECPVPAFYDKLTPEDRLKEIKAARKETALDAWRNNTADRLRVREEVKRSRIKMLKRGL